MRFLEHFTNLGERGISRAERVCRKQVVVLVVSRRRAWQRLAVGVDRGEGLSAPRGTTQGKAAQQLRSPLSSPLLKNEHVYSFLTLGLLLRWPLEESIPSS